jgi:hypothetical protein
MRRVRPLAIWLNVAVLSVLVALAYATPPDPTYLAGFWDNADYDDVVILVTSSIGSTDTHTESDLNRLLVAVYPVLPREESLLPGALLSPHSPRAPPVVRAAPSRG